LLIAHTPPAFNRLLAQIWRWKRSPCWNWCASDTRCKARLDELSAASAARSGGRSDELSRR